MLTWMRKEKKQTSTSYNDVISGMQVLYREKLLPLEENSCFHDFHSQRMSDQDFSAKPMIMLVGQYSTGKTTFIKYLLEEDYPGLMVGVEPTTDGFVVIMNDQKRAKVPGNALVMDPQLQFKSLQDFGNNFLNRLMGSVLPSSVLESLTIVDTPGILAGEKQRTDRGYDFTGVISWFAERVDRIIVLFDAHKLDISDEFRDVLRVLKNYESKVRIVLNKADIEDVQQLMHVYGAMMWSLAKVFQTPEVCRVYMGTFWNEQLRYDYFRRLFEIERTSLFSDLSELPLSSMMRKLDDFTRRARLARVQAYIGSYLKAEYNAAFTKGGRKKELINNLDEMFKRIASENNISIGNFPEADKMKQRLAEYDFKKFHKLNIEQMQKVDQLLDVDIPALMKAIPQEQERGGSSLMSKLADSSRSPFNFEAGFGVSEGKFDEGWIVDKHRAEYDKRFRELNPINGFVTGGSVRQELLRTKLPDKTLSTIWKLADYDRDGFLNKDEFALCKYLTKLKLDGHDLPNQLPYHLIPPAEREYVEGESDDD